MRDKLKGNVEMDYACQAVLSSPNIRNFIPFPGNNSIFYPILQSFWVEGMSAYNTVFYPGEPYPLSSQFEHYMTSIIDVQSVAHYLFTNNVSRMVSSEILGQVQVLHR